MMQSVKHGNKKGDLSRILEILPLQSATPRYRTSVTTSFPFRVAMLHQIN